MTAPRTHAPHATRPRTVLRRPSGRPDPERLATAIVHAYLEVEAGRRPVDQLRGALSPSVYDRLRVALARRRREVESGRRRRDPGPDIRAVRALQVTRPAPDVLEAAVAVHVGQRTTAVCVRLECWRGAWRITELARPEDGLEPIPSRRVWNSTSPATVAPR